MGEQQGFGALAADEWGDAEYAAFGGLMGMSGDQVPRAGSGHRYDPLNFEVVGHMVRHPGLAKSFLRYNNFLLQGGTLPTRLRELAILRVAHRRRSAYEWGQHVAMAHDEGVTDAEIDALVAGNDAFDGTDRLTLDATDDLIDNGRIEPSRWESLLEALGTHAAMELIFVVGTYATLAMAFETWELTPESGTAPLPDLA